ncbi:uncharacterized protein LOC144066332 isoform X2 [Stigmatopora argus]
MNVHSDCTVLSMICCPLQVLVFIALDMSSEQIKELQIVLLSSTFLSFPSKFDVGQLTEASEAPQIFYKGASARLNRRRILSRIAMVTRLQPIVCPMTEGHYFKGYHANDHPIYLTYVISPLTTATSP